MDKALRIYDGVILGIFGVVCAAMVVADFYGNRNTAAFVFAFAVLAFGFPLLVLRDIGGSVLRVVAALANGLAAIALALGAVAQLFDVVSLNLPVDLAAATIAKSLVGVGLYPIPMGLQARRLWNVQ